MASKKYPDVFEDLPQETSSTNNDSPNGFQELQSCKAEPDTTDDEVSCTDMNLTLKENLNLFIGIAQNQKSIIDNQCVINGNMKTTIHNQKILENEMLDFSLSDAKKTEIQGDFDDMAARSAGKVYNAIQEKCERYIKRIEFSKQVLTIPPKIAYFLFTILFSLTAFFALIVVTNALIWESRMIWQITGIITGFAAMTIGAINLMYKYLLKDNDR